MDDKPQRPLLKMDPETGKMLVGTRNPDTGVVTWVEKDYFGEYLPEVMDKKVDHSSQVND